MKLNAPATLKIALIISIVSSVVQAGESTDQERSVNDTGHASSTYTNLLPGKTDPQVPDPSAEGEADLQRAKNSRWLSTDGVKPSEVSKNSGNKSSISIVANCTDSNGRNFKSEEPGYATCLESVSKNSERNLSPKVQKSSDGSKVESGVKFNFGK
jgi:hypothetical protein